VERKMTMPGKTKGSAISDPKKIAALKEWRDRTLTVPDAVRYLESKGVSISARAVRYMCERRGTEMYAYKDQSGAWVMPREGVDMVWGGQYT
jgi:hypothetical protein